MIYRFLPEWLKRRAERRWFDGRRRRAFYEKVAELYDNGIRIDAILESFGRRAAKGGKAGSAEAGLYRSLSRAFAQGGVFSKALSGYAPVTERVLVSAGERSGHLSETLRIASDLGKKDAAIKEMALKAVMYPLAVAALAICVLCWFSTSLFPALEDFIPLADWPAISRFLYAAGLFIADWSVLGIAVCAGLAALFVWSLPNFTGPLRIRLDRIPPWSFYRLTQGAAWIASLASMIESGTTGNDALSIIHSEARGNRWLRERTMAVRERLGTVPSLAEALNTRYAFPDAEFCEDMIDYAGSANFDAVLARTGREWISDGMRKVERDARILNGCVMGFAMLVIVGLLQSIMALMMDVSGVISGI